METPLVTVRVTKNYNCYKKENKQVEEKIVILKSIGIVAIVKQGQSSTPADIPVDIFINPIIQLMD